jgi:hypothetical protein
MMVSSGTPIRDGFCAVTRPVLLAELTWGWLFGLAALLLVAMGACLLLAGIEIDRSQAALLHSRNPWLMAGVLGSSAGAAGAHILRLAAILLPALTVLWMVAVGIRRTVTLRLLLHLPRVRFRPQLGLSFLRATLGWLTVLGYGGMLLLWGRAMRVEHGLPPGMAGLVFLLPTVFVVYFYSLVNELLAAAPIFAARDGLETFSAVSASAALFRSRTGQYFRIAGWFCLWRLLLLAGAGAASLFTLALIARAPVAGLVVDAMMAMVYCVMADYLILARLGAYAAFADRQSW